MCGKRLTGRSQDSGALSWQSLLLPDVEGIDRNHTGSEKAATCHDALDDCGMTSFSKDPAEDVELNLQLGVEVAISGRHVGWWDLCARKCTSDG